MTALPSDALADLYKLVAELEQRLESSFVAHDAAIARQAATDAENGRLINEISMARERENASAEILHTIANARGDAERALYQIAEATMRLFDAPSATIHIAEGDGWSQVIRVGESSKSVGAGVPEAQLKIGGQNMPGTIVAENRQVHVPDLDNVDPAIADWPGLPYVRAAGTRSMSGSPLRRDGSAIGVLIVYRDRLAPFTDEEMALQQSFADQAAIAIENARLFNETKEALERQTATAEILKVIADSPSDAQPVFEAIAASSKRLLGGFSATVLRFLGDELHLVAYTPTDPAADEGLKASFPRSISEFPTFELVRNGETVQFPDSEAEHVPQLNKELARLRGFRSVLFTPLMNQGAPVGMISVTRAEPGAFAADHVQLLQTFADQAVIAIENARLFNETRQALERQTATADILKVIAGSPSDVQPVFEAIVAGANRLIGGFSTAIFRFADDAIHLAAFTPTDPAGDAVLQSSFPVPSADFPPYHLVRNGAPAELVDTELEPAARDIARARGYRSMLFAPLMNEGKAVGIITVTRRAPGPFGEPHVQLLQMFAAQSVIAIENVRLFNETREALEQQKASADILRVVSNSVADAQPVFDEILRSIEHLFGGDDRFIYLAGDDGLLHIGAAHGANAERVRALYPVPLEGTASEVAFRERRLIRYADVFNDPEVPAALREVARRIGTNYSMALAPMLWEDRAIGSIFVGRTSMKAFSEKECSLLRSLADQAVIAIQNARLFNEVRQRTDDLSESLQQQTATADVLKVISRAAFDLPSVLDTLVSSAALLCGDPRASIYLLRDGLLHLEAAHNNSAEWIAQRRSQPLAPSRDTPSGRAALTGKLDHVPDLLADPDFSRPDLAELGDYRATLNIPMTREGVTIGVLSLARPTPGPFTQRQVELVQTFADQAVIAIENVRLFDEVEARTRDLSESLEQQTATSEVLSVISRSAGDLEPVFQSMLENATRICGAQFGLMNLYDGDSFHTVGFHNVPPEFEAARKLSFRAPPEGDLGQMIQAKKFVHIHDLRTRPLYIQGDPATVQLADLAGVRTILIVPMVKDDEFVGTIGIYRLDVAPFNEKQIALLGSFASQAVIAIENTRLLKELRERTGDLTKSLDDLRTAQDRLVQTEKLASLGQLTAGIAHEIKNPLNFVNNFAALSAELTDELNDVLKAAEISDNIRGEVNELTGLLKDNLHKVVQHGQRADSIVKNMLLHSREGSGDHRPADINALIDESLNLAYHGARAEKPGFNVTLQRDFDPDAGMIELFPQEITRVFLNLVSNGFYAVTKRRNENGDAGFDPVLRATTRNLGDSVEIRIRDNGTGIPPEVKDKMFNPFFTTKPAGEGTGLGLSMSHDIVVKQHGGTIEVDTEPGQFTEFRIVLPKTSNATNKNRGQT